MRVYHFVNHKYGLEDLKNRYLKISTLDELNDPFELFGINLADKDLRHTFRKLKDKLTEQIGLLCFSRDWHNPVLWSHYAEKHQGLCLGFDIPDKFLKQVSYSYSRKLLLKETEQRLIKNQLDIDTVKEFLITKYAHWSYEDEVRWLYDLEENIQKKSKHVAYFSDDLKLAQVIVGAESTLKRAEIHQALGDYVQQVETFKARLGFQKFEVVHQMYQELWK